MRSSIIALVGLLSLISPVLAQEAVVAPQAATAAEPNGAATASAGADQAGDFYCQRKLGTWFYCEKPRRAPGAAEAPPSLSPTERMKAISAQLEDLKARAVLEPTTENVSAYIVFQREQLDRATTFADVWQRAIWQNPSLDYTLQRPVTTIAKRAWVDNRAADRTAVILSKSTQFSGFDQQFKELIMTLVGTIITQPSTDPKVGGKVAMIGAADDSVVQALLDGTESASTAVKILQCDEATACLNPTLQSLTVKNADAIRPKVRQLIMNMATAIRTDSAIGTNEKALLNVASIPLYKVLAVQAASHVTAGADEIDTIAEITSIDIVQSMLQNLLDSFEQSRTSLVKADEHTAAMWQQSITNARQRIANRGVSISQRVEVTMRVIDRTMMLESTLQNSMSPGMTAALNFGHQLNAQGIVQ